MHQVMYQTFLGSNLPSLKVVQRPTSHHYDESYARTADSMTLLVQSQEGPGQAGSSSRTLGLGS